MPRFIWKGFGGGGGVGAPKAAKGFSKLNRDGGVEEGGSGSGRKEGGGGSGGGGGKPKNGAGDGEERPKGE